MENIANVDMVLFYQVDYILTQVEPHAPFPKLPAKEKLEIN